MAAQALVYHLSLKVLYAVPDLKLWFVVVDVQQQQLPLTANPQKVVGFGEVMNNDQLKQGYY